MPRYILERKSGAPIWTPLATKVNESVSSSAITINPNNSIEDKTLSQPSAGHNYNVGRRVVWAFNKHASEYDKRTCARDKTFVQGNAEELEFKDSAFDAVFTVTT
jgi:hypothetical protein